MRILIYFIAILPLQVYSYPKVTTIEKSYVVEAKEKDSLLASVNKASPIRQDGEVFHAYTDTSHTHFHTYQKTHRTLK